MIPHLLKYALVFFFPESAAKSVYTSAFALSMFTLQDAEHRVEVLVDKSAEPESSEPLHIPLHNAYHVSGTFLSMHMLSH